MPARSVFVALLRAVNVGGTGVLPMRDLVRICETAGFEHVRTYIQSGNVVFTTRLATATVKARLSRALATQLGKPVGVILRTGAELAAVARRNPFPSAPPNRVLVLFLDQAPAVDALDGWRVPGRERLRLDGREVFIHFPDGMGGSKLKLPFAEIGTGRNLNTVGRLAAMAGELDAS
jgi:uncharacterized protein (DUF1697 family)